RPRARKPFRYCMHRVRNAQPGAISKPSFVRGKALRSNPSTRNITTEGPPDPVKREMGMEIVIESNANCFCTLRQFEDLQVLSGRHPEFAYVNGVTTLIGKDCRCPGSKSLVQQNTFQATRCIPISSSSTVVA